MRILIYCPVYRLEPETVHAILTLDRGEHAIQVLFDHENPPGGDERLTILYKYSRMRGLLLARDIETGFDAVLIIESDIIPPKDALLKLVDCNSDLATGLYMFRRSEPYVCNAARYIPGKDWADQSYSLFPDDLLKIWGKKIRVSGLGIGCILIQRHVMEGVPFVDCSQVHCDWGFSRDVLRRGYKTICDMSIICGHKRPDGMIIWPTQDGHILTKGEQNDDYHLKQAIASGGKANYVG